MSRKFAWVQRKISQHFHLLNHRIFYETNVKNPPQLLFSHYLISWNIKNYEKELKLNIHARDKSVEGIFDEASKFPSDNPLQLTIRT